VTERYGLYGVIPVERDVNTTPMTLAEQNIGDSGDTLLYETSDTAEARAIYEAGGFERNGKWHAVTRVEDRFKRSHTQRTGVPSKTDKR
jgi:hypothetical protein